MGGSTEGTGAGSCLFVPVISSSSGTHSKERRRWLPPSALSLKFALAPKKPSEPNPPPVAKTQSNPRKKKKDSLQRTEHSGGRRLGRLGRDEICRAHLTKTRLSAGQGPRWESSGTIRGSSSIRHRHFVVRASAFVPLRGRHVCLASTGAVLAYRDPGVTPCALCRR